MSEPPYDDSYDITAGVKCYLCDKYTGTSWGKILRHLQRMHGKPLKSLRGTWLHAKGTPDLNAEQQGRYTPKASKPSSTPSSCAAAAGPTTAPEPAGNVVGSGNEFFRKMPDGTTWRLMWVKTGPAGIPAYPVQLMDPASAAGVGASEASSSPATLASQPQARCSITLHTVVVLSAVA